MHQDDFRLGVIGAGGWLGRAIVGCVLAGKAVPAERLYLSTRTPREGLFTEANWVRNNQDLVDRSDVVILSVRPMDFSALKINTAGKLVLSVMSSISIARMMADLGTDRIVRALPNAAAEVARSYTPWVASPACSDTDRAIVRAVFATCGSQDELPDERRIEYFAAVSGTGPAYLALLADALRKHAIANGIAAEIARNAVNAMLIGTGRLVEAQGRCPSDIVGDFLAYQGMTTAALESMMAAGLDRIVSEGVEAALIRAQEL